MLPQILKILSFLSTIVITSSKSPSLDFVKSYELCSVTVVSTFPHRTRRDVTRHPIKVFFSAYGRKFDLMLNSQDLVQEDAVVEIREMKTARRTIPVNRNRFYQGFLLGTQISVHGILYENSLFDGVINDKNETYYIEPASRYDLSHHNNSVIYRFSDLKATEIPNLSLRAPGLNSDEFIKYNPINPTRRISEQEILKSRPRRVVAQTRLPSSHCTIHLFADHRYFSIIGLQSIAATIDEMIYHIGQADGIFRATAFDGRATSTNIGLIIAKLTITTSDEADDMREFRDGDDARQYLERFSLYDHSEFCLGVMFTVIDFADGTLGMAWIASPNNENGGICGVKATAKNDTNYFFNSGFISMKNHKKLISRPMFSVTVAHEIGHSFGSEHDKSASYTCAPGGSDGNYIMFHISGDGLKPNHFSFSSCSINDMYKILLKRMSKCFTDTYSSFCSNTIIDDGEDCDCGTESSCAEFDPCCSVYAPNSTDNCKLKPSTMCSPMLSVCCSMETCGYTTISERRACRVRGECVEQSFCDGRSAECPPAAPLADGTLCYNNLKICSGGECKMTICQYNNLTDCYCTSTNDDCYVCCGDSEGNCKRATSYGIQEIGVGEEGLIPVNGLCQDGNGICDSEGICIFLNGSFARADILTLVKQTASRALTVVSNYWYFVVLGIAVLVFLIIIFIKIHKANSPIHSIAYKDGRMARVWFEVRERLAKIEQELHDLEMYDPYKSMPYPIALKRLTFQFPTAPPAVCSRFLLACDTEVETVHLMIMSGYPMRKLIIENFADLNNMKMDFNENQTEPEEPNSQ